MGVLPSFSVQSLTTWLPDSGHPKLSCDWPMLTVLPVWVTVGFQSATLYCTWPSPCAYANSAYEVWRVHLADAPSLLPNDLIKRRRCAKRLPAGRWPLGPRSAWPPGLPAARAAVGGRRISRDIPAAAWPRCGTSLPSCRPPVAAGSAACGGPARQTGSDRHRSPSGWPAADAAALE